MRDDCAPRLYAFSLSYRTDSSTGGGLFASNVETRYARIFGAQSAKHLADQNDDIFYEDAKRRYGLWYMNIGYK